MIWMDDCRERGMTFPQALDALVLGISNSLASLAVSATRRPDVRREVIDAICTTVYQSAISALQQLDN